MQRIKRYLSLILITTFLIYNLAMPEVIVKGEEIQDSANQMQALGADSVSLMSTAVQGLHDIVSVAEGSNHTIALKNDGTVWAWGRNGYGQLGNGTTIDNSIPEQVIGLSGIIDIAAGESHTIALKSDGTVWTWGRNRNGQLGDGTIIDKSTPVQVTGLNGVIAIAGGGYHTIALKNDGTVWAWGYNSNGQLGDGTSIQKSTPVQVTGIGSVVCIEGGSSHTIALKDDGTVWTWGYNYSGQLGDGTTINKTIPIQVAELSGVTDIAAGGGHTIVLKNDGTVWVWGSNHFGQLGDGTKISKATPIQVAELYGMKAIAGGEYYTIALKNDGTVWAWGMNWHGELGDGTAPESSTPVQVIGLSEVIAISAGSCHTSALKNDGTVWAWGRNDYGQLGNGNINNKSIPVQVTGIGSVVCIGGGSCHTIALKDDGTVWTWGVNDVGQLGNGTKNDSNMPIQVVGLNDVTYVATGNSHTIALRSDGTVWAWGNDMSVQRGFSSAPVQVVNLSDVISIAAGAAHTVALKNDGTVWTWGVNYSGQLGDGTTTESSTPVQVIGLSEVIAISAGSNHTLALKNNGTVWTWGSNYLGQLGDGTTTESSTPVQVIGLSEVIAISAGSSHTLALKNDGTLWAWGFNGYGQLGDGTTIGRITPVQITELSGVIALAGGSIYSIATKNDGTVWTWGDNVSGQLGDGTTINRSIPVQVTGLNGVTAIAGGGNHTIAIKNDGTLWTWGNNSNGQLGDGVSISKSTVPLGIYGTSPIVEASFIEDSLALSYSPIGGTLYYEVEIDGVITNNGKSTKYTQSGLDDGETHTIRVRSVNYDGYGLWSEVVTASIKDIQKLKIQAQSNSNDITLTWNEITDATSYDIKADGVIHNIPNNLYFTHTGLLPETTHVYQIRSVKGELTGDWSEELVFETKKMPPTVPANLTLQASSSTVTATWDEIPNGGVVYQIQIDGKIIDTGFENTYTHKNLSLYSRHTYRVRAVNSSGAGEWSQVKSIITKFLPPTAPTLKAVGSKDKIVITWDEVLDASNYIIEAKCSDPNIEGITIDNKKNTYRIIYGESNTTYYIKVKSKNSAGESAWSEIQVKTYALETPEFEAIEEIQTEAHLTWTSVEGATSYEVERDGVVVGTVAVPESQDIETVYIPEFRDTGLTVETTYSYRVRALGENITDSNWSYVVEVITLPEKPPVPEKFYATGANEMVTLSWQPVTEASAYDLEIDGVIIENGNKTVYTFRDIQPKTEHFYRVRSRNTGIEGDWHEGITLITLPDAISPPKDIHVATTNTITKIAWEKVPDAIRYEVEVDGVIVYSGTRTEFIHRRLALNEEHIYKIRSKGYVETSKWSEEIVNNAVTLVCDKGKDAKIGLSASEVTDFEGYTLTVVYNPDVLEVKDLCNFSDEIELQAGEIEGTDITITYFEQGKIEFKVNKAIELGKSWSGIINSIKFEGKLTGGTTITYTVFIEDKELE